MLVGVGQSFQQARPFLSDIKMLSNHDTSYFSKKARKFTEKKFYGTGPRGKKIEIFCLQRLTLMPAYIWQPRLLSFFPRDFQLKDQREKESKKSP
jgi:hypothetical protein